MEISRIELLSLLCKNKILPLNYIPKYIFIYKYKYS